MVQQLKPRQSANYMPKRVIIDTDPGVDDAMAIQFAFNSPELEILGLTTVFGNAHVDVTTSNTLRLVELGGHNYAVAKGADRPIRGEFTSGAAIVHGEDGQGNTWAPQASMSIINLNAEDFIIDQILSNPEEVTIVTLGPLTNLANAATKAPEIIGQVREIVMMGGNAFCPGNATPSAEANVLSDCDAADFVLGLNWPITMVGLDVTHKTILTGSLLDEIANISSTPLHRHVSRAYKYYRDFFQKTNKIDGTFVHDSSVIAYLIDNSLFQRKRYPVRVETTECISRGKTWPSSGESDHEESNKLLPWRDRPHVNICVDVDSKRLIDLLKSRLF